MNNSVRCLLLLSLALCHTGPVLAQPAPKKVALLAGVNVYQKRGFSNLDYAERDATELEKELKKLGFKTVLLTGSGSGSSKATRKNIDEQLLKLLGDTGKQDIVLVALSGHGQQLTVKVPGGGEREDGFYCPYDAEKDNPASQFSLSYLTDDVLAKKGGRNLVLVDACRDEIKDAGRGSKGVQGRIVSLPEDTAILFSCRAGQRSWESDTLKHGVFTYCVLDGLRGGAAKGNDISWANLVSHVDEQMASQEMKKYLAKVQEPISAGGVGRTVLGSLIIPKPIQLITSKSTGMKLTLIPAGTFQMGSSAADLRAAAQADSNFKAEYAANEQQHSVRISQPFYMGVHEVTQGEYESVMGPNPSKFGPKGEYSSSVSGQDTSKFPVENVSWFDAIEFCNKLSAKDGLTPCYSLTNATRESGSIKSATVTPTAGKGYRLPTEAEWEYACRGGSTTVWHTGNTLASLNEAGWWGAFSTPAGNSEKRTNRVGQKSANAFGLFDMHGNVYEWCFDVYDESVYGKRSGTTSDPMVTSGSENRVLRGGSWNYSAWVTRAANRYGFTPDYRDYYSGFRVVCIGLRTP